MVSAESGIPVQLQRLPLSQNIVYFKIECRFNDRSDQADFYYSMDGKSWNVIGRKLKMSYTIPHFMGYRFGLFSYATRDAGGFVDFDFFRIEDRVSGKN